MLQSPYKLSVSEHLLSVSLNRFLLLIGIYNLALLGKSISDFWCFGEDLGSWSRCVPVTQSQSLNEAEQPRSHGSSGERLGSQTSAPLGAESALPGSTVWP